MAPQKQRQAWWGQKQRWAGPGPTWNLGFPPGQRQDPSAPSRGQSGAAHRHFSSRFCEFPASQLHLHFRHQKRVQTPKINTPHPLENMLNPHRRDFNFRTHDGFVFTKTGCVYKRH